MKASIQGGLDSSLGTMVSHRRAFVESPLSAETLFFSRDPADLFFQCRKLRILKTGRWSIFHPKETMSWASLLYGRGLWSLLWAERGRIELAFSYSCPPSYPVVGRLC